MFWFVLGVVVGFMLAAFSVTLKIVGNLGYVIDEGDVHFFMKLSKPDVGSILSRKYVVLEVDEKPTHK